ncbi:CSMD1 [Branchiostoma lanceolatum]|uniref:CSMD1 protein n=1 Tax=Branchiostoma lanceolatum TaxID=7740 RepID=A0A8S4MN44_BRALA|nr:CSMD1 [Branchiostoma lanceolatum]
MEPNLTMSRSLPWRVSSAMWRWRPRPWAPARVGSLPIPAVDCSPARQLIATLSLIVPDPARGLLQEDCSYACHLLGAPDLCLPAIISIPPVVSRRRTALPPAICSILLNCAPHRRRTTLPPVICSVPLNCATLCCKLSENFALGVRPLLTIRPCAPVESYRAYENCSYVKLTFLCRKQPCRNSRPRKSPCRRPIEPQTIHLDTAQTLLQGFQTEMGYDYMNVYDGTNSSAQLGDQYTGHLSEQGNLPAPLRSSGNRMTIVFHSDSSIGGDGFQLSYQAIRRTFCLPLTAPMNGTMIGNNFNVFSTISFSCDDGYELPSSCNQAGRCVLTCTSFSGTPTWDKPVPTCTGQW